MASRETLQLWLIMAILDVGVDHRMLLDVRPIPIRLTHQFGWCTNTKVPKV